MKQTILITGASTGIGNLTARALATAGHTVYATMRDVTKKNSENAKSLKDFAAQNNFRINVVDLDVQSQESSDAAVEHIISEAGRIDVVVHNAGHLVVGYAEAFTAEDLQHLFDINVFGMQRVNRSVLPHMRERHSGTLIYVGSTSTVDLPPFLAPYVSSKSAFDALAATTAYEVGRFGIESTIVQPGPFTSGTQHFPNATQASDKKVTVAYSNLDELVARNEDATSNLFDEGVDANPVAVADEIVRILSLPKGQKPARSVIDFSHGGVETVNAALFDAQSSFLTRLGFSDLLEVRT